MLQRLFVVGLAAVCLAAPGEAETEAVPGARLTVGASSVTITSAQPGATYYFAGYGRTVLGPEQVRRYFTLDSATDDNQDGQLELVPAGGIPEVSFWAAKSRSGGSVLTAIPPGFPLPRPQLIVDDVLTQGPDGPLLLDGEQLVVVFREGVGAWVWKGLAETVPSGDVTLPSRFLLEGSGFDPLGANDPVLESISPDDLLFAIDQRNLNLRRLVVEGVAQ